MNRETSFNAYNYAKKSITLDLARPKAVEVVRELVKISDAVVENFAYGVMERLGLDYPSLSQLKPDIIVLSVSILGRTGPHQQYLGWGPTGLACTGLPYMTGHPQGPPRRVGGAWPDPLSAQYGAIALLAALHYRTKTGEGQFIDLSMVETVVAQLPEAVIDYVWNRRVPGRMGNDHQVMAPHGCYRCQGDDKWVAIAVCTEEEWQALARAMGDPPWWREERFSNPLARWRHRRELDGHIEAWTRDRTAYQVMEALQTAGVPAGPSLNAAELMHDRHLQQRGFFVTIDHPEVGKRLMASLPAKMSANTQLNYRHSPVLGEHSREVFGELLGLAPNEIAHLMEEGVIC